MQPARHGAREGEKGPPEHCLDWFLSVSTVKGMQSSDLEEVTCLLSLWRTLFKRELEACALRLRHHTTGCGVNFSGWHRSRVATSIIN